MTAPNDLRDDSPPPMVNLAGCRACGKQVSKTALLCPHCGQIAPGPHIRRAAVIFACVTAFVLLILGIGKIVGDIQTANEEHELEMWRYNRSLHEEH